MAAKHPFTCREEGEHHSILQQLRAQQGATNPRAEPGAGEVLLPGGSPDTSHLTQGAAALDPQPLASSAGW